MPHPCHIDRQRHIARTWGGCAGRYGTFCYVRDPGDLRSSEGDAMTRSPLTILFMPESAYGPTNNCIGIGNVLRQRGHRVVFAAEASWKGRLEPLGFEEDPVALAWGAGAGRGAGKEQGGGRFWREFIASPPPEFRNPTIERLET